LRDYAKVSPQFWNGSTGVKLRNAGGDAQRLALYLMTCPSSNMLGLYYLPKALIGLETGMGEEGASEALRRVCETNFAAYDDASQVVFVLEMARFQIGDKLEPKDNRVKSVAREIFQYRKSPFFQAFMKRYGIAFAIEGRVAEMLRSQPSTEAPSKALRSQEQEQEQENETEKDNTHAARVSSEPGEPASAAKGDVVLVFDVVGNGPRQWALTRPHLEALERDFPGVDVLAECRKAHAWQDAAGPKRKTAKGMKRFLSGWMGRAQDRSPSQNNFPGRLQHRGQTNTGNGKAHAGFQENLIA
jgi:hypothetical protein